MKWPSLEITDFWCWLLDLSWCKNTCFWNVSHYSFYDCVCVCVCVPEIDEKQKDDNFKMKAFFVVLW